jgi:adhesin transport system outer membrane protein
LLGALKLQALSKTSPESSGGTEADDELMQCSTQLQKLPTLDRTFDSRPANLPADPVKPPQPPTPVPVPAASPVAQAAATCMELPKVVEDWLSAWNRKDVTRYLATYSDNFVPAKGMKRKQWEAMRKTRISKQGDLQIAIGKVQPVQCDAKTAEVSFPQEYGSVDYKDKVEKTLLLEQVQGVWKITKETVTKGRTY